MPFTLPLVPATRQAMLPARQARIDNLYHMVQGCRACPRMEGRRRVLSTANGRAGAPVMFIAEAPGRNGAERTGIPVYGDPTGANFENLLLRTGWRRQDVYVTNAVLCNPQNPDSTNDTPSQEELMACSFHLDTTIRLVGPLIIATLGGTALKALNLIEYHGLSLRSAVARPCIWAGYVLFPLYHPSPRGLITRKLWQQLRDFIILKSLTDRLVHAVNRRDNSNASTT